MAKLVDMAYTKAELKEEAREMKVGMNGQPAPYPWGLCLRFEAEELDKLGIKELPQVGGELHIMAVAKVTGVNMSAREGQEDETSVALQITMMQVILNESAAEEKAEGKETPAKEAKETASVMDYFKGS